MNEMGRTGRTNDRGAAMVEFALILPILVVLLLGIMEFGRAYNAKISIQAAAREGARALALDEDPGAAVAAADDDVLGDSVTITSSTPCPGPYATVTVSAPITYRIPFINLGTRTISATASMRCGL